MAHVTSGFLRGYEAEMAKFTDAPDIFHTASAYAVFGALLTRHKYRTVLDSGVPPRWTNLWVVLVGDSGDSRKSTALSMANEVLMRVDPALVAPTDGSPEGFLQFLLARHNKLNDKRGGNACGILVSSEFSTMLAGFQKTYAVQFKSLLMDFYDVPPVFKRALSKTEWQIPRPRVSMLGGIATELLPGMTTSQDWLGGFFSRCLLVPAVRTRTLDAPSAPTDEVYDKQATHLYDALSAWRKASLAAKRPRLAYSKEALKVAKQLPPASDEPNLKMTLSRASVHLMKVAAIEQIDEDPTRMEIGKAATERALAFVCRWLDAMPDLLDECFARGREDFEGDRLAKRLYRYCVKAKGVGKPVPYAEAMRAVALSSEHMRKAITSLMEAKMIEQVQDDDTDELMLVALPVRR